MAAEGSSSNATSPDSAVPMALAVGAVLDKHKMAKHFDLVITDATFSFARKTTEIAAEGGERWHLRRAHQPARGSARRRGDGAQL
jgi:hypothetical protein